jgi:hypothetical protein
LAAKSAFRQRDGNLVRSVDVSGCSVFVHHCG